MTIVLEEALGMSYGHNEATMLVERYLNEFQDAARNADSTGHAGAW
jgi:hypothetical protein